MTLPKALSDGDLSFINFLNRAMLPQKDCHPRTRFIGDPDFKDLKDWIPDYNLGNDKHCRLGGRLAIIRSIFGFGWSKDIVQRG